jgi:hypothetical protein
VPLGSSGWETCLLGPGGSAGGGGIRLAGIGATGTGTVLTWPGATGTGGGGKVLPRLGVVGEKVGTWAKAEVGMATAKTASKLKYAIG